MNKMNKKRYTKPEMSVYYLDRNPLLLAASDIDQALPSTIQSWDEEEDEDGFWGD